MVTERTLFLCLVLALPLFHFYSALVDQITASAHVPVSLVSRSKQWKTRATKCEQIHSTADSQYMKSQSGEDAMLLTWFSRLCGGTYIELGALDGVKFSNSHVFHYTRQWKGVLIELMEYNFNLLTENRKDELATIHAGVCDQKSLLHYYGKGAIGGIYEFSAPSFRKMWWGDVTLDDPKVKTIECDTMDSLLKISTNETYFDFLSLDVEGAEMTVLKSIDFDRVGFGIVLAEANEHNPLKNLAMRHYLQEKGYDFLMEYERSYWWVNKDFHNIHGDVIY